MLYLNIACRTDIPYVLPLKHELDLGLVAVILFICEILLLKVVLDEGS